MHRTVLETERLRLGEFSPADAAFVLALLNEPGWITNIGDRGVRTLEDARAYLLDGPMKSYAQNGYGLWRVALKQTDEPIGMCGLIRREHLEAPDVGYAILQAFWGCGYAEEAARATVKFGRQKLGMGRIVAITTPDNAASGRVLEKIGFARAGRIRQPGAEVDSLYFVSD